ncbi:hypothetical protein OG818_30270 [Streptomyces virginiae]|uniref:hypothetical protein n=1 Tax=Streptomyces virginiae TaxID=1961 RepID=UPI002257804B|nr:hypothetical protein [Streptomyces virginiae]MCX4720011.1 hypothetical protein [Streptomyces virginiae]
MATTLRDMGEIRLGDTITADTPPTCCNEIEMAFFAGQFGNTWACILCDCELHVSHSGRVNVDPAEDRAECPDRH